MDKRAIASFIAVVVFGILVGEVFGQALWGLIIALLGLLFWQSFQQYQLLKWMNQGAKNNPPDLNKPLNEVVSLLIKRRKQARKRKRKSQELLSRLRELAQAMPDAAMVTDEAGVIVNFNKAAEKVFGLKPHLDVGANLNYLIRNENFSAFWRNPMQKSIVIERYYPESVFLQITRVFLSKGNVLVMARDVSELMLLNQKRQDFIANASYELKSPLIKITTLLEEISPQDCMIKIDEIKQPVAQVQALIEDMLLLARLENKQQVLAQDSVVIRAFLQQLSVEFSAYAGLKIEILEVAEVKLTVDEQLLRQMLWQLLENAWLHAHSHDALLISATLKDGALCIAVKDKGIGIAPNHLARITERFYRVAKEDVVGTGLGLSIVKHAMKLHGGTLHTQSVLGQGSVFALCFPMARVSSLD